MTYIEATQELKQIVEDLQNPDTDLESLQAKVLRAKELIKWCQEKLRSTEEEVKNLLEE